MKYKIQFNKQFFIQIFLCCFCIFSTNANAEGTKIIEKRDSDRKKERWQFSDYLSQKKKIFDMDLVYRMYTGQREKPYPRIEPMLEAGFASVTESEENAGNNVETGVKKSFSGRATLHFNNFVTGIFKIPMPNIVLGSIYQFNQFENNSQHKIESVGGSLRLFSKNQQDGAIFIEALRTKGRMTLLDGSTKRFIGWENQARAQFYLFPAFGINGGAFFPAKIFKQSALSVPTRKGFEAGGFFEIKIFRFGYMFQKHTWEFNNQNSQIRQELHLAYLGLTI
jgi:hypothetical protein